MFPHLPEDEEHFAEELRPSGNSRAAIGYSVRRGGSGTGNPRALGAPTFEMLAVTGNLRLACWLSAVVRGQNERNGSGEKRTTKYDCRVERAFGVSESRGRVSAGDNTFFVGSRGGGMSERAG